MPTFSYKGYDFEVDHTPTEEEFKQMSAHVDTLPPKAPKAEGDGFLTKAGKSIVGGAEAIGSLVSSIPGSIAGPLMGVQAITRGATTREADKIAGDVMESMTYAPRTEKGQEYSEAIGEVMNKYVIPVAPMLHSLPSIRMRDGVNSSRAHFSKDEIPGGSRAKALEAEMLAEKPPEVVPEAPKITDTKPSLDKSKEAYQQALREKELQRQSAFHRPDELGNLTKESPMDRMTRDLGGEPIVPEAPQGVMGRMAAELDNSTTKASGMEHLDQIDRSLAERQAAMELEVKTKTALEQQAAEMARQESAPVFSKEHLAEVERVRKTAANELALKQEELINRQKDLDAAKAQAQNAEQVAKANDAQKVLDARKVELELEVKKQATLDFNAAERSRQLNAGPSIAVQVDNHPFVKAAENRVTKQAEIITKIQMALEAGKPVGTHLVRAMNDLKGLEAKVDTVRTNVGDSLSKGASPKPTPNAGKRKSQSGVLYLGEKQGKALDQIKKVKALEELLPEHTTVAHTPEEVAAIAAKSPDVDLGNIKNKFERQFTKGFLYEKSKTNNPIIKYTYDKVSEAIDSARKITHNLLQKDLLPKLRELTNLEMIELHEVMQSAMSGKYQLSKELLAKHGFSEKQIATWDSLQRGFDTSFNNINEALASAGKQPITKYTAYMAGMATGDFRTPIMKKLPDGTPSIVGFIGSDVSWMRDVRVKNFLKAHPEYTAGEGSFHGAGYSRSSKGDSLVQALNLLSENNPNIAVFSKELAEHMKSDAYGFQGANKHTLDKKGVFGMEGNKQWVTGWKSLLPLTDDMKQAAISKQNALDGFRAQVKYIESMAKWSELSKATADLAKVVSDPAIQQSQKNAIAMSKEYIRNALGDTPSLVGNRFDGLVSAIGESVGVGPSVLNNLVHNVKGGLNTVFFALNPTFLGANFVQGVMTTPMMVNFLRGRGIDVARFDKMGMTNYMKASLDGLEQVRNPSKDSFTKAMWQYGEDHGISSTQIFDHATDIRQGVGHATNTVLEAGMGIAEGVPRSTMFAMFSNILKDAGYGKHPDIFKVARELTDTAMHDYRPHEGQRINRALGPLAPLVGNLSTFSAGANSVIAKMVNEATSGKGQAFAAMAITGLVFHGLMGGSGFAEADKAVEKLSAALGKPTTLTNEVLKLSGEYGEVGDLLATGIGSTLGLDTHAQLGRASVMPTIMGGGSIGAAWDQAKAGWVAATKPSEMNTKRLAYQMSPKLLKGIEDVTWFSQGNMAMNKKEGHSTEALYERTPFDTKAKMLGSTSLREFKLREQTRQQSLQDMHLKDKQESIMNALQDKRVTSSGLGDKDVTTALDKYIEVEGDPKKFITELKKYEVEISVPVMTRYLMNKAKSGSVSSAKALERLQDKSYGVKE